MNRKHLSIGDPMGNPIVKIGTPKKVSPSPCTTWTPSNTPMSRPTPSTFPNPAPTVYALSHRYAANSHISYNGAPHICPKNYLFPLTDPQSQLTASSLDPSDLPPQTAPIYPISRFASMHRTDKQTDTQANRWLNGIFDDSRPLSLYRKLPGLIILQ